MPVIHILHTNDFHNTLNAEKAAFIRGLKAHFAPNVLLLDAGDAVSAGNLGAKKHEPVFALMAGANYDAMAMGNRESHPTIGALVKKLKDAKVPVLAANVHGNKKMRPPRIVQEYLDFDFGLDEDDEEEDEEGFAVSVFGLAPQITAPDSFWAKMTDFVFDDPQKTGPGLAAKLHLNTELVIALTHIGYERDMLLAECPDIDIIIGGHSHREVCPPEKHGHAYVAATGSHGKTIGHLVVTFEAGVGVTGISGEMIALP
ncbi:MAG: metallophosphoesterase [bacterium]